MKLLLATEANEGMGHIAPWSSFVTLALQHGVDVHMAAPDLARLNHFTGQHLGMNLWQAPCVRSVRSDGGTPAKSWPEILVSLGYADVDGLTGAVKAWINIFKSVKPDVVMVDYAPALMLAARVVAIPVIEVGSGFCVPPLLNGPHALPGIRQADQQAMRLASDKLTHSMNAALHTCGHREVLDSFAEIAIWPARRVVTSPPELDHYGERGDVMYAGFLGSSIGSATTPSQPGFAITATLDGEVDLHPSIVGYLKAATPGLDTLIEQLRRADVKAHIVVPDGSDALMTNQDGVVVTRTLVDLSVELPRADVYLSNGGLQGVGQALKAGCWPVVVPMQAEQVAMARQLVMRQWGSFWLAESTAKPQQTLSTWFGVKNCTTPFVTSTTSAEKILVALVKCIGEASCE
jgi:hypothetical protein